MKKGFCKEFLQSGRCSRGDGCRMSHGKPHKDVCTKWLEFNCAKGLKCRFKHEVLEDVGSSKFESSQGQKSLRSYPSREDPLLRRRDRSRSREKVVGARSPVVGAGSPVVEARPPVQLVPKPGKYAVLESRQSMAISTEEEAQFQEEENERLQKQLEEQRESARLARASARLADAEKRKKEILAELDEFEVRREESPERDWWDARRSVPSVDGEEELSVHSVHKSESEEEPPVGRRAEPDGSVQPLFNTYGQEFKFKGGGTRHAFLCTVATTASATTGLVVAKQDRAAAWAKGATEKELKAVKHLTSSADRSVLRLLPKLLPQEVVLWEKTCVCYEYSGPTVDSVEFKRPSMGAWAMLQVLALLRFLCSQGIEAYDAYKPSNLTVCPRERTLSCCDLGDAKVNNRAVLPYESVLAASKICKTSESSGFHPSVEQAWNQVAKRATRDNDPKGKHAWLKGAAAEQYPFKELEDQLNTLARTAVAKTFEDFWAHVLSREKSFFRGLDLQEESRAELLAKLGSS